MKYLLFLTLIIVGLVIAVSCKLFTKKQMTGDSATVNTPYFSLSKSPCRGTCTVYNLTIDQAGNVYFNGIRNTEKIGKYTAKLSAQQFTDLQILLKSKDFAGLQKDYPTTMKDMQEFTIQYQQHRIHFQRKGGPKSLFSVIDAVDDLVKNLNWQ